MAWEAALALTLEQRAIEIVDVLGAAVASDGTAHHQHAGGRTVAWSAGGKLDSVSRS